MLFRVFHGAIIDTYFHFKIPGYLKSGWEFLSKSGRNRDITIIAPFWKEIFKARRSTFASLFSRDWIRVF